MMRELVIGARGSALAMWQAEWVRERLLALRRGLRIRIEKIRTEGDVRDAAPLWQIGGTGLFVKEVERALLEGRIDVAVHSMKDLPSSGDPALVVAAVPERDDPRDVLVSRRGLPLAALPEGARVATSSSRRRAQLLAHRCDLQIVPLRGNVDTRLRKSESEELDGVVLAAAGLARLGHLDRVTEYLSLEVCLPAPGQGALAVQARAADGELLDLLAGLEHPLTRAAVEAERAFMRFLGGGCQVPMAALCHPLDGGLVIDALVASPDGSRLVRVREFGGVDGAVGMGEKAAERLLALGGADLLEEARG